MTLVLAGCGVGQDWYEYRPEPAREEAPPNRGPVFTLVFVAPLETSLGGEVQLSAAAKAVDDGPVSFRWEGKGGVIKKPTAGETTYTCAVQGTHTLAVRASSPSGSSVMTIPVTCADKGDH